MEQLVSAGVDEEFVTRIAKACYLFRGRQITLDKDVKNRFKVLNVKPLLLMHQLFGMEKIRIREISGAFPHGGLQCDEMGLGKTLQVLLVIALDRRNPEVRKNGATLIVVPSSLLSQWQEEIKKIFENPKAALGSIWRYSYNSVFHYLGVNEDFIETTMKKLSKQHLVITTYHEVSKLCPHARSPELMDDVETDIALEKRWARDFEAKKGPLHRKQWHRVVLDEAHATKNHKTKTSMACVALKATHYWAVTGTPFPNGIHEAYPYFKLLRMPHTDSYGQFSSYYLSDNNRCLNEELKKIMLRRDYTMTILGQPIVDIPETTTTIVPIKPTDVEAYMFTGLTAHFKDRIEAVKYNRDMTEDEKRELVLAMVQRLRQLIMHWFLVLDLVGLGTHGNMRELLETFSPNTSEQALKDMVVLAKKYAQKSGKAKQTFKAKKKKEQAKIKKSIEKFTAAGHECPDRLKKKQKMRSKPAFTIANWLKDGGQLVQSSKTQMTVNLIGERLEQDPQRKFVVFTQSLEVIRILSATFKSLGWGHERFHGQMSQSSRDAAKKRFFEKPEKNIFIMSMFAGGQGLNLTCANCVINMDFWWNEAKEKQAFMRVVRIGQTKETEILRLQLLGTLDEDILAKQKKKQAYINQALESGSAHGHGWSLTDLIELFDEPAAGNHQTAIDVLASRGSPTSDEEADDFDLDYGYNKSGSLRNESVSIHSDSLDSASSDDSDDDSEYDPDAELDDHDFTEEDRAEMYQHMQNYAQDWNADETVGNLHTLMPSNVAPNDPNLDPVDEDGNENELEIDEDDDEIIDIYNNA